MGKSEIRSFNSAFKDAASALEFSIDLKESKKEPAPAQPKDNPAHSVKAAQNYDYWAKTIDHLINNNPNFSVKVRIGILDQPTYAYFWEDKLAFTCGPYHSNKNLPGQFLSINYSLNRREKITPESSAWSTSNSNLLASARIFYCPDGNPETPNLEYHQLYNLYKNLRDMTAKVVTEIESGIVALTNSLNEKMEEIYKALKNGLYNDIETKINALEETKPGFITEFQKYLERAVEDCIEDLKTKFYTSRTVQINWSPTNLSALLAQNLGIDIQLADRFSALISQRNFIAASELIQNLDTTAIPQNHKDSLLYVLAPYVKIQNSLFNPTTSHSEISEFLSSWQYFNIRNIPYRREQAVKYKEAIEEAFIKPLKDQLVKAKDELKRLNNELDKVNALL